MTTGAGAAAGAAGAGAGVGAGAPGAAGTGDTGGAGAPGAGAAGTGTAEWYASFQSDELKGYAKNKGWKDPSEAVESYRQFEKLQGVPQERLIKLPEKADDPSWSDINFKLGVPKEAKEYQFEVPKDVGDQKFADTAKEWFHKNGVPRAKAEAIVKDWNGYVAAQMTERSNAQKAETDKQVDGLKKEWGAAFDQNIELGKRVAKAFGFDAPTIDQLESVMGFGKVMKFMHSLHEKIGEDKFVGSSQSSGSFGGIMTPDQAKAQIALRKKDSDFTSRLLKKDSTAVEEWTKLHKMAMPEQY